MEDKKIKKLLSEHKMQLTIGGGVVLLIGGYLIGKKIGKGESSLFSRQLGDVARDIKVTQPIPLPENVSKIYKQIDEDVFVDIATEIEDALIDLGIKELHIDRSWEVADGITKTLEVSMKTINN